MHVAAARKRLTGTSLDILRRSGRQHRRLCGRHEGRHQRRYNRRHSGRDERRQRGRLTRRLTAARCAVSRTAAVIARLLRRLGCRSGRGGRHGRGFARRLPVIRILGRHRFRKIARAVIRADDQLFIAFQRFHLVEMDIQLAAVQRGKQQSVDLNSRHAGKVIFGFDMQRFAADARRHGRRGAVKAHDLRRSVVVAVLPVDDAHGERSVVVYVKVKTPAFCLFGHVHPTCAACTDLHLLEARSVFIRDIHARLCRRCVAPTGRRRDLHGKFRVRRRFCGRFMRWLNCWLFAGCLRRFYRRLLRRLHFRLIRRCILKIDGIIQNHAALKGIQVNVRSFRQRRACRKAHDQYAHNQQQDCRQCQHTGLFLKFHRSFPPDFQKQKPRSCDAPSKRLPVPPA